MPRRMTPTMRSAVYRAEEHGRELRRYHGAYWAWDGIDMPRGIPAWYVGRQTIFALIERGVMEVTERNGRDEPTRVRVS